MEYTVDLFQLRNEGRPVRMPSFLVQAPNVSRAKVAAREKLIADGMSIRCISVGPFPANPNVQRVVVYVNGCA